MPLLRDHPGHLAYSGGFAAHIGGALPNVQGLLPELERSFEVALLRFKASKIVHRRRPLPIIRCGACRKSPLIVDLGRLGIAEHHLGARNGPETPVVVKRSQDQAAQGQCFPVTAAVNPPRGNRIGRGEGQLLLATPPRTTTIPLASLDASGSSHHTLWSIRAARRRASLHSTSFRAGRNNGSRTVVTR